MHVCMRSRGLALMHVFTRRGPACLIEKEEEKESRVSLESEATFVNVHVHRGEVYTHVHE